MAACFVGFLLFSDPFSTLGRREKNLYLKDPEKVTLIRLSGNESSLQLQRSKENRWVIDGRYPADDRKVNRFLGWLQRLRIQSVAPAALASAVQEQPDSIFRLRVYSGRRKSLDLYVSMLDLAGGHFIVWPARPQRYYLAESFGSKTGPAEMLKTDPYAWRSLVLFALDPASVSEVYMSFPSDPEESFVLKVEPEGDFSLLLPRGDKQPVLSRERAIRYLSYFIDVRAEYFVGKKSAALTDSLKAGVPFRHIRVATTANDTTEFILYRIPLRDEPGMPLFDPYRMFVYQPAEKDLMVARFVDMDPLLKNRSYFIR